MEGVAHAAKLFIVDFNSALFDRLLTPSGEVKYDGYFQLYTSSSPVGSLFQTCSDNLPFGLSILWSSKRTHDCRQYHILLRRHQGKPLSQLAIILIRFDALVNGLPSN